MSSQINIIRGNTRTLNLTFKDSDGNTIDISNYTVWFTVRSEIPKTSISTDTTAAISKKQLPAELTDPTNGVTTITLSSTDTNIDVGSYYYDIQIQINGSKYSNTVGKFIVSADVTRG